MQLREQWEKTVNSQLPRVAELQRFAAETQQVQEQFHRLLQPRLKQAFEGLRRQSTQWEKLAGNLADRQLRLQHTFATAFEPQRRLAEQLQKLSQSEQFSRILEAQKQWEGLARTYLSTLDPDAVRVSSAGDIAFGNDNLGSEEVSANLESLTNELATASTPLDYLLRLSSYLSSLRTPLAQVVLLLVLPYVLSVIANLTTPVYEEWWREVADLSRKEMIAEVSKSGLEAYDLSQLQGYRFVTANQLRVRGAASGQSKIIAHLPKGKVVRIIEARRHWSMVEYFDHKRGRLQTGWVATSYLAMFEK